MYRCSPKEALATASITAALVLAWPAGAQTLVPVAEETQVNTYTTGEQTAPAVAAAGEDFVIVWQSAGADDANVKSILAQRHDSSGQPAGAELRASFSTSGDNFDPDVAMRPDDEFVVVWAGPGLTGDLVLGQRFDSGGSTLGGLLTASNHSGSDLGQPAVAYLPGGDIVVAWRDDAANGTGASDAAEIIGRRFDSAGGSLGDPFRVNSYTTGDQSLPRIGVHDDGDFVVVWESAGATGSSYPSVLGQRFASNGTPVGDELQLAVSDSFANRQGDVATLDDGFLLTHVGPGFVGEVVQGRRFDTAGAPVGPSFLVTGTVSSGLRPRVAVAGELAVVSWDEDGFPDDGGRSLRAEAFDLGGDLGLLKASTRINTGTTDDQTQPVLAQVGERFVVAWRSDTSAGDDSDVSSIQRRFVEVALFADGFENGGTTAWSGTSP